jgi:hypothetical protein
MSLGHFEHVVLCDARRNGLMSPNASLLHLGDPAWLSDYPASALARDFYVLAPKGERKKMVLDLDALTRQTDGETPAREIGRRISELVFNALCQPRLQRTVLDVRFNQPIDTSCDASFTTEEPFDLAYVWALSDTSTAAYTMNVAQLMANAHSAVNDGGRIFCVLPSGLFEDNFLFDLALVNGYELSALYVGARASQYVHRTSSMQETLAQLETLRELRRRQIIEAPAMPIGELLTFGIFTIRNKTEFLWPMTQPQMVSLPTHDLS